MNAARLILSAMVLTIRASQATAQPAAPDHVYTSDLITRWGRAVRPDNAWRSYPRPQLRRSEWQNLNGEWFYAIRPKAQPQPDQMDGQILVPFAVESKLSGVSRAVLPDQRLWYKRTFNVPAAWRGQRVLLHFGAVDFEASVSVNGALVGAHRGGFDRFSFDVTDYLKPGSNELVVQVTDPTSTGAQPRGKQQLDPHSIWYTPVTGIWQTVWLEPVPALHVEDVHVTPDIDAGQLQVDVALNKSVGDEDAVRITVREGARTVSSVLVRGNRAAILPVPNARLWSPDTPFLYDLDVELVKVRDPIEAQSGTSPHGDRGAMILTQLEADLYASAQTVGGPRDLVTSYFAMRKSSIGRGRVMAQPAMLLNNKPLFQNGTLDQGWWPDGLLTPPSEEAIRWEIKYLKDAGFNMLRKHIKVEPEQYYYEADRQGLLIWQDMPSGEEDESLDQFVRPASQSEAIMPPSVTDEFESELIRMISALRNHPSIVTWVVDNEGWGQYASARLARMVKDMDPSRVVDATSGWLDAGDTASDLFDIHTYEDVPNTPSFNPKRAVVVGEFGGIGLPIDGHLWFPAKRNWGYQTATGQADYRNRLKRKYDEIIRQARQNGLSASVYTQTTDVEGEVNGLLTYDREVSKIPAGGIAKITSALPKQ